MKSIIKLTFLIILILLISLISINAKVSDKYDHEKLSKCIKDCENPDSILALCYQGHKDEKIAKKFAANCLEYAEHYEKDNQDHYLSKCYDLCKLYSHK